MTFSSIPSNDRKRLILLCSEDLRLIACCVEDALRERGWEVDVEFGSEARPWVQKAPVGRPSLRVLCIPGTVDRTLAAKLRTAFSPEPDADLHILGVDDHRSMVQEIERLAGVRTPRRRPLSALPRLSHPTLVERQAQADRGWRAAATTAVAAFALTMVGGAVLEHATIDASLAPLPAASLAAAPISSTITQPTSATAASIDEPVMAAMAPITFDDDAWDTPPEEEDDLIIFDDEPAAAPTARITSHERPIDDGAPSLADAPAPIATVITPPGLASPLAVPGAIEVGTDSIDPITSPLELPAGFLPVGELEVEHLRPILPPGFLPVAGLTAMTTIDPFSGGSSPDTALDAAITVVTDDISITDVGANTISAGAPVRRTVDPFATSTPVATDS
ncbi:MAG: hypothetical protein K0V04_04020 [Deltaproteobacteria bacterium]|nr:hypothetical protein [Deltaproteobacteria bacterium]